MVEEMTDAATGGDILSAREDSAAVLSIGDRKRKAIEDIFIAELSVRGIVAHACLAAGVVRQTPYKWRAEDPEFAERWDTALENATDALEAEALRRAVDGTEKPVYQGGICVGYVREYSDPLMLQMLKANRPDKHRDKSSVELTGKGGGPLAVVNLTDEELAAEAAAILARSGSAGGAEET